MSGGSKLELRLRDLFKSRNAAFVSSKEVRGRTNPNVPLRASVNHEEPPRLLTVPSNVRYDVDVALEVSPAATQGRMGWYRGEVLYSTTLVVCARPPSVEVELLSENAGIPQSQGNSDVEVRILGICNPQAHSRWVRSEEHTSELQSQR